MGTRQSAMTTLNSNDSSGNNLSRDSPEATAQRLEQTLFELVTRMKRPRKPVNIVITGPPGCDTRVLCHFLKRYCGFVYESIDPDDEDATATAPGATTTTKPTVGPSHYSRHDVERAQGLNTYRKHLREAEDVVRRYCQPPSTSTGSDAGDVFALRSRVLAQHLLTLERFQLRHLRNTPTADSMLNADHEVWQRSLWRVFHGAPNDEMYGYVCTSSAMHLLDRGMHAVLQCQGNLAMDVMFKDCSPSNTLWVYCMPTHEAYAEMVDMAVQSRTPKATAALGFDAEQVRTYYWQTYRYMENMYRQSQWTASYWSLLLETHTTLMDRLTMLNIAIVALNYLVDTLMHHEFWGSPLSKLRQEYLASPTAISDRVKFVPQSGSAMSFGNAAMGFTIPPLSTQFTMRGDMALSLSSNNLSRIGHVITTANNNNNNNNNDDADDNSAAVDDALVSLSSSSSSGQQPMASVSSSSNHHHHHHQQQRHSRLQHRSASDPRIERVRSVAAQDLNTPSSQDQRRLSLPMPSSSPSSSSSSTLLNNGGLGMLRAPVDLRKEKSKLERAARTAQPTEMHTVDLSI